MYSTKIGEETLSFGTSGLLYRSNKLMYDRGTQTLWRQFTGEPVVGPLADSGIRLQMLPVVLTTWSDWVEFHPDTTVLDISDAPYGPDFYVPEWDPFSIYFSYRLREDTMFPVGQRSDLLATKAEVLGIVLDGAPRAYPLFSLAGEPVVNDRLGETNLVVVTKPDAGSRAYERGSHSFSPGGSAESGGSVTVLLDEEGRGWRIEEEALILIENPEERLARIPTHVAYWFGWYASYPDTDVYRP